MTAPVEYVMARSALIDALIALRDHSSTIILIGAQAVYEWTGEGELAVAVMTTDADLALDANRLDPTPEIAATLTAHGFSRRPGENPGQWLSSNDIAVDLMVSEHQAGKGRRSAKIPPHESFVARRGRGLAPALIDNELRTIEALSPRDFRRAQVLVASPAALIVAKCIKIKERHEAMQAGERNRIKAKDSLDIFRLLYATETAPLADRFMIHRSSPEAGSESREAISFLATRSADTNSLLPQLAAHAADDDAGEVAESFVLLVEELLLRLQELDGQ